jgi:hypothetical protein
MRIGSNLSYYKVPLTLSLSRRERGRRAPRAVYFALD